MADAAPPVSAAEPDTLSSTAAVPLLNPVAPSPTPEAALPQSTSVASSSSAAASPSTISQQQQQSVPVVPLRAWVVLVAVIFAISAAAGLLRALHAPAILKGTWRLIAACIVILPGFVLQFSQLLKSKPGTTTTNDAESVIQKQDASPAVVVLSPVRRYLHWRTQGLMLIAGTFLAAHFSLWISSLDHTSIAHSLLLVTSHPVVLVAGESVLVWRGYLPGDSLSRIEQVATLIGFLGLGVTTLDAATSSSSSSSSTGVPVTFFGDLLAFLGAISFIAYLLMGRVLRRGRDWMPLFLYVFPLTLVASIEMGILSAILEHSTFLDILVGWFAPPAVLLLVILLAGE